METKGDTTGMPDWKDHGWGKVFFFRGNWYGAHKLLDLSRGVLSIEDLKSKGLIELLCPGEIPGATIALEFGRPSRYRSGRDIIEDALIGSIPCAANLGNVPWPMSGPRAMGYLEGAKAAYQHSLEMMASEPFITEEVAFRIIDSFNRYMRLHWPNETRRLPLKNPWFESEGRKLLSAINVQPHKMAAGDVLTAMAELGIKDVSPPVDPLESRISRHKVSLSEFNVPPNGKLVGLILKGQPYMLHTGYMDEDEVSKFWAIVEPGGGHFGETISEGDVWIEVF